MYAPICTADKQQQIQSSDEALLEPVTLWNVILPTGLFACDTQSHGHRVHQCTVALWHKLGGIALCAVAPNPVV